MSSGPPGKMASRRSKHPLHHRQGRPPHLYIALPPTLEILESQQHRRTRRQSKQTTQFVYEGKAACYVSGIRACVMQQHLGSSLYARSLGWHQILQEHIAIVGWFDTGDAFWEQDQIGWIPVIGRQVPRTCSIGCCSWGETRR